jgi:Mlc titration factor MtfA (ptsG expression regulator)
MSNLSQLWQVLPTLLLLAAVPLGLIGLWYFSGWRLKQALAQPFPTAWRRILQRRWPLYNQLPPLRALQLRRLIAQFLYQKQFIGCAGLEVTEEMKLLVAAQACLLLVGRRRAELFPRLSQVLLYPSDFVVPRNSEEAGVVTQGSASLAGESWSDGRVILAWDRVLDGLHHEEHAGNVVIHEFAHQLDSESGVTNGAPVLPNGAAYQRWAKVMQHEFEQLRHAERQGAPSVIDFYGAQNPAEFFAVICETFFMQPQPLFEQHLALYQELSRYFRVDPRAWH